MKKILDNILSGEFAAQEVIFVAGIAVALFVLIGVAARIFKKKEKSQHVQTVDCLNCGWEGKVSRYAGRCPKCNEPLGERKAQRRT